MRNKDSRSDSRPQRSNPQTETLVPLKHDGIANNNEIILARRISSATEGLPVTYENMLSTQVSRGNAVVISNYIVALKSESNASPNYRIMQIQTLVGLSRYLNQKLFSQMTREDIISFLEKFHKPEELDPLHKWIGTYNIKREIVRQFFSWFYDPNTERNRRKPPPITENIPSFKRKEISIYKPTDLWTQTDDLLFLSYCPHKRDRCYHMVARDSSCRPHELLRLRLKDVVFKITEEGKQYAEILVNGKTGIRSIPLISSIPYLKDWYEDHPQRINPTAFLFPSLGDRNFGRRLSVAALNMMYRRYRLVLFPRLLTDPNVRPEDITKIRDLLRKPWNPYIRRHSALTEKSIILKEHILRQHAGWSGRSQMHLKYLHYFGNESNDSILEAYGIIPKDKGISHAMKPNQCPNCSEPNKPDSKFCARCRMVLTYDAYDETLEKQKEKESEISRLRQDLEPLLMLKKTLEDQGLLKVT